VMSNWRSVSVATAYSTKAKLDGTLGGVPHAYDFMAYAYLQLGQDMKARGLIQDSMSIKKVIGVPLAGATARAAVPARYMLERQDWQGAAQLQPLGTGYPMAEAITYFARAMGGARSGDAAAAQADIEKLKEQRAALEKAGQGYWAGQVEIQILAAQGWTAQGQGNKSDALKFMRAAADLEDASEKHVAMENRLYPMRELLADMLMVQGESVAALKEYETSLKNAPMRLRGFYGAAKAAEVSGDKKKAREYFEKLAKLTRNADGDRSELREMKQRLASK
jgi:tetratricopeptide (TPR) repeat protein